MLLRSAPQNRKRTLYVMFLGINLQLRKASLWWRDTKATTQTHTVLPLLVEVYQSLIMTKQGS